MSERCLQLDDLRTLENPEKIATLFKTLGYNASSQPLDINDLQLSARNSEAIYDAYLIADQGDGGLQVLLFQLHPDEWLSPSVASTRIKSIAAQVGRRATEFLLLATKDYNQLMLVNCRKSFDENNNVKASIRKLLVDRTNPTAYDRDRLEAIAVKNFSPKQLYQVHCEAFDVEKLTKSFYKGYKQLFDNVQKVIKANNPHLYFNDSDRLHQFSQRLLGRIMFIYFLQKKEFLSGDSKFLTTRYKVLKANPDDTDYYSEVLEPLFFNTLNQLRPNLEHRWGEGKIPYLNGGLFDRDYGVGIKDAAGRDTPETITLPNSLFDPGESGSILSFFNGYNFTISENVAGDEDVAVDPEMLGKVFENMLAAEERGQSGTFYTPRGIVQFMCVEVLSRYLADESGMELETVRKLIDYDPDEPDSYYHNLMTPPQAKQLKQAIATIKVLDPAVGSGAFPLGMMQALLQVRQAVARREGMKVQRGSLTISQWKREIIANNLYGVDIKPEAIEIAKLRMWLSLVVDIPNIEDVEPLPNLDYKLMCGDSLISTIHDEHLIPDPAKTLQLMLVVTPIQQAIQPLLELQRRYFDAQTEERHQLREQILAAEANVFRVAVADRRLFWEGKQRELEDKIQTMKGKVSKAQEKERAEIGEKLMELDRFATEVESGECSLNFFQYHLHFRDVFTEKGGFDVVIGNPPYIGQKGNKTVFEEARKSNLKEFFIRNMDYFYFFFHLALNVCKKQGYNAFITTNYYLTADGALLLRQDLKQRATILKILNFNELSIFESAKGQHNVITIFQKNQTKDNTETQIIQTKRTGSLDSIILDQIISGKDIQTIYTVELAKFLYSSEKNYISLVEHIKAETKVSISSILEKIINSYNVGLLGDLCYINQGILSGIDKITNKHIQKGLFSEKYRNHGVFIISQKELTELNLSEQESKIIRPFFKNSDITKYVCSTEPDIYIIYATRDIDINDYPKIKNHFEKFRKAIESRSYDRGEIQAALKLGKWWVLFATRDQNIFTGTKIVCPQRTTINNFAYNEGEWYAASDVYFIKQLESKTTLELKYILGLLNSKLYYLWLLYKGKTKGKTLELVYTPLTQIPISLPEVAKQQEVVKLVDKILTVKQFNPNTDTSQLEAEIDNLIYQLYGLTDEEIAIVENST
jgi:methylase of polypeptide subunit release factors